MLNDAKLGKILENAVAAVGCIPVALKTVPAFGTILAALPVALSPILSKLSGSASLASSRGLGGPLENISLAYCSA